MSCYRSPCLHQGLAGFACTRREPAASASPAEHTFSVNLFLMRVQSLSWQTIVLDQAIKRAFFRTVTALIGAINISQDASGRAHTGIGAQLRSVPHRNPVHNSSPLQEPAATDSGHTRQTDAHTGTHCVQTHTNAVSFVPVRTQWWCMAESESTIYTTWQGS